MLKCSLPTRFCLTFQACQPEMLFQRDQAWPWRQKDTNGKIIYKPVSGFQRFEKLEFGIFGTSYTFHTFLEVCLVELGPKQSGESHRALEHIWSILKQNQFTY